MTDAIGAEASISVYNDTGTQSLASTDTYSGEDKKMSLFWDKNDKDKQIVHGHSLSELTISGTSKSASWGGVQTFTIDNETDCIGDLYLSIKLDFDTPDTPLDADLSPKTITTLLQKPSSRDALKDPSKLEKKGWYKRGIAKGDTHPKPTPIGFPNGWLHLKTDANDLGSGFRSGDGGLDAADSYGLPADAIDLPGVWGVHQDSAPRAQAWEDIQDVLVKDKDLFTVQEFDCKDTYLDPNNNEELIYQRDKDIGIGEFIIQDQGRTASNCYSTVSKFITSTERFRSSNIMQSYYHNGLRNKFNDEFTHPNVSDQNSFTPATLFNDEKLVPINADISGIISYDGTSSRVIQFSAYFPNTVTYNQLQANLNSYNTELYNSLSTIASELNVLPWSGNITSTVVPIPNRNWDSHIYFCKYTQVYSSSGISYTNTPEPYGDGRPQDPANIWNPQATLSFDDPRQNGSIAHILITADQWLEQNQHMSDHYSYPEDYAIRMEFLMTNYKMPDPFKNWPGDITYYQGQPTGWDGLIGGRAHVKEYKIIDYKTSFNTIGMENNFNARMENHEGANERRFQTKPGEKYVTAEFETIDGVKYIRLEFWKPYKINDRDITPEEMELYITSTRSILTEIQNDVTNTINGGPQKHAIYWNVDTHTGNGEIVMRGLFERSFPNLLTNRPVGDFIGGGVNNDYSASENQSFFNISTNPMHFGVGFNRSPHSPSPAVVEYPQTEIPPVPIQDPNNFLKPTAARVRLEIPNSIYNLNEVTNKGPFYAEMFSKFLSLYSIYIGISPDGQLGGVSFAGASYIGGQTDDTPNAKIIAGFDLELDFTGGDLDTADATFKTILRIVYELDEKPPALNTIKNRKGHDNIISPSLIPYVEHPTLNPYTYSYLPKYLSYNDSEEIKKLGTEYIDVDENGVFRVYRSQGVLASDLFISYLNKQDINNLVDYYNHNISHRPLFQSSRDLPETFTPQDGDIISYLQKIEAVEDPPRRPDNLIYYQSDFNGYCTAMSSDGNTYAVSQGRMYGDESEAYANVNGVDRYRVRRLGLVRVFKKENGTWTLNKIFRTPNSKLTNRPKGHVWYVSNGYNQHVDLSGDGNRIVIGDAGGDNNSFTTYDYNNVTKKWTKVSEVQYGHSQTIIPQHTGIRQFVEDGDLPEYYTIGSEFGSCLSLSEDGNRIALRYAGPEHNSPNNTYTTEHSVKIYNWDGTNWQEDNSTPTSIFPINHPTFVSALLESHYYNRYYNEGLYFGQTYEMYMASSMHPLHKEWLQSKYRFSRGGSLAFSGDGNTYIIGDYSIVTGIRASGTGGTSPDTPSGSGFNVYNLINGIWTLISTEILDVPGLGHAVAINYNGTCWAVSNIQTNGMSVITIYNKDTNLGPTSQPVVKKIYGKINSYLGTSLAFNRDGTKLILGSPHIYEKHAFFKSRTKDFDYEKYEEEMITLPNGSRYPRRLFNENGRIEYMRGLEGLFGQPDIKFDLPFGEDINSRYINKRGGPFFDTFLGAIDGWGEYGSEASLGMRSNRPRFSNGEIQLYEYISGSWVHTLDMDASSGERSNSKQKSWPGTFGRYGVYEGNADGLGISVSMSGDGNTILAGAPFTSTIGKIQEKLDWYPGGGMSAAYSIHEVGQSSLIEDGDPVSSVLLADTSLRSHIRETDEEVGRSYLFEIGKYTHNPPLPHIENKSNKKMKYTDGYNIVNDAQIRLNHDITDFINLPDIGEPIRWDKQFNSVPDGAYYPPLKGDYQNPQWADSDLKSKVDFPIFNILKKIEIIVNDKVWQTIENKDLLSIYSTEMTESLYNVFGSNSRGRTLSDGTRKENSNEKWIPGKSYDLTIPIPGFTSSVDPRFNNFTNISENGFLAGIAPDSKFTVKVYYNELEKIWDTNNVSAMQGYTAPIYRVPHVTNKIEDGQDSNGNPSSLVKDGARYETTGKSSGTGLYVTNVPEPWNPKISFNSKMYGQKIVMNREELDNLKNTPGGINKVINTSQSINTNLLNITGLKPMSVNLDSLSLYASHIIINLEYFDVLKMPYLKTAQLFLNSKPHSILEASFMKTFSSKTLGLYNNEYNNDKDNLNSTVNNYVYPLASKAFGGSSIPFSKFDSISMEFIFDTPLYEDSGEILSSVNINVLARGKAGLLYKDGTAKMEY